MRSHVRSNRRLLQFMGSLVIAFLLVGCGGDSTGPSGNDLYLRFRANGVQIEYTQAASLFAAFATTSGQSNVVITGYDASSGMSLQAYDGSPITTETYSGFDIVNQVLVGVVISYEDAAGTDYASNPQSVTPASITITEVTSTRVRGTFQGVLSAGQTDVSITEGQFVVQRAN